MVRCTASIFENKKKIDSCEGYDVLNMTDDELVDNVRLMTNMTTWDTEATSIGFTRDSQEVLLPPI